MALTYPVGFDGPLPDMVADWNGDGERDLRDSVFHWDGSGAGDDFCGEFAWAEGEVGFADLVAPDESGGVMVLVNTTKE